MKIFNTKRGIIIASNDLHYLTNADWDTLINEDSLLDTIKQLVSTLKPIENAKDIIAHELLVPMQSQELWASGVTYYNSKLARQEESKDTGGGSFYENVYHADRPELFFKANVNRTVPSGGKVHIRKDSTWDVPEPELTLVITSSGKIIGYTIGNDMSSRSIEGENPLYLPQAKTFDGCAGIGPCIYVTDAPLPPDTTISIKISRKNNTVFEGNIEINKMKRKFDELVNYLFRECTFPSGCLLMTGTGIVPSNEFTLQSQDRIDIAIDVIGTLTNHVR